MRQTSIEARRATATCRIAFAGLTTAARRIAVDNRVATARRIATARLFKQTFSPVEAKLDTGCSKIYRQFYQKLLCISEKT